MISMAMYKTRNTGTGNGMRGKAGNGGNVVKHSGKNPQIFRGLLSNIPGNIAKISGEYPKTSL